MPYPSTINTRLVSVGIPREALGWREVNCDVTLNPLFDTALDTTSGGLVRGVPQKIELRESNGWQQTVQVLAGEQENLSITNFDLQVSYSFYDGLPNPDTQRIRIPKWTGTGTAPVLDLDVILPVTSPGSPLTNVPFVTPDQLTQALAGLTPGAGSGGGASQPLARGFDPATDAALAGTTPRLARLNSGTPVIVGSKQSPDTHYNWSVIATAGVISNPVDAYYAYDSPDHGGAGTNGSGVRWYTAPNPAGPWTHRRANGTAVGVGNPLEYVYRDPSPVETETPTVFAHPQSDGKSLHMFYQEKSAGPQVTRLARSSDGRAWTREPGFELLSGGDHSGYMRVARWGRRFLGWSRATSGSGLAPDVCMQWHCIGDPKLASSWVQDSRRLLNHEDATGVGWSINWANMSPFTWYGRTWALTQLFPVGKSANPALGIAETDRRFVLMPMSPDLRRLVGPVTDALSFVGTEVPVAGEAGWRTTQLFTDTDGTIYVYYITSDDVYVAKVV